MVKVICNSSSIALASLVLLTRTAFAQSRPEMAARCEKAEESDQAETAELPVYRSHAMRGALRNEAAVWAFVTDPKTPYMDRMATAYQGAFLTSAQQLPRLWKAKADFDRLPTGVEASPCLLMYSAAPKGPWMTGGSIGRTVPFPHERKDRGQMPIVWQMQKALKILTERTASFNSSPERFRAVAEVALRRQPSEFGAV